MNALSTAENSPVSGIICPTIDSKAFCAVSMEPLYREDFVRAHNAGIIRQGRQTTDKTILQRSTRLVGINVRQ